MYATNMNKSNEKSIHEMLKNTPSMNDSTDVVHTGSEQQTIKHSTTLTLRNVSNHSLSSPTSVSLEDESAYIKNGSSKLDTFRNWSITTYKCTKQIMLEKLGKSTRTVDLELEAQIDQLKETQKKYLSILRLSRAFTSHFYNCMQTQSLLSETFADLAQKSPELQEEFLRNAETQRILTKNGELLLNALNFFISSINTLCNKTIEDTLLTIRQYELARVEYDAYRVDMEQQRTGGSEPQQKYSNDEVQKKYEKCKDQYEKLRSDIVVKMQFLEENRIKVMHKQLLLFHNAIAAYFAGNANGLEKTLQQFNISLKSPNSVTSSWLEQ
ncbi:arfaptin-2 [Anopheles arabiensis]|uniref:AGAP004910-PA n=6 Tax=Pyretophorus TaxID=44537 RepID=Q7Q810_ANOGA|nr:arfaptin-2 [Anopheles arabiensis]XP_040154867.1 arfaptin-2 [Anopheles arabiensis]XP_040154868.1 arfaptin-2 [Anopheles arabiensis]XP_040154869.1 arfaptin-2 [Anopheles arabiensis]XP_040224552.1 arfaptin-2 [Anopheles coluzzii]XP_040224553.1 arfaptin-2 [Anopheles coluzzii]XP_040224554.1 arfaptin-2 [Anopheles coluzzii]XP_040224555.1 arfaptin-2 [Anopheles coluzzii]XP_041771336.1 arfaptin-2 [Anopheles merus]XP_041771337.1 arfaptin-2 [Anopheles merus]EAA10493.3 AGAP004910-PA [Anopheles gambiae